MRLFKDVSAYPLLVAALLFAEQTAALTKTNYSTWMATSIISRGQGVLTGQGDTSELLQAGFTQKAFRRLLEQYPDDASAPLISAYITTSVDSVAGALSNASRNTGYSLDRLSSGNNLIALYQQTGNETYRTAFEALRQSIDLQRRNAEGGLFYYVYPYWSYLDGMFSLAPFYALYTAAFDAANATAAVDDLVLQLDLLWQHCHANSTGLLAHGYDASRTAVWADPVTGASPHVWGRSLGWYAMALVDVLELLPATAATIRQQQHVLARFQALAAAVAAAADAASGAWWQVLDQPGRAGNYIESSGSAMLAYSLLKGVRLGYLAEGSEGATRRSALHESAPNSSWTHVATRAYEYVVDHFVVDNGNGTVGYNGTVAVCSLNSTASYEYYVGQPILYDSVLGSNAFILASLEYESMVAGCGE
ncbi:Six-hairpin glycosidase-like protein [Neofusicoccum parvum]|uniref:Six-hairpin glycosidase-like protein n=1 Tax=Neofusicoccum parvum TaxID=310453 RepID=A0ACB5S322_9PEZI|nr:Six-hairpin glycosidase-like protein [Neofusicoccum parvum]